MPSNDAMTLFYWGGFISFLFIIGLGFGFAYYAHNLNPDVSVATLLKYYWIVIGCIFVFMSLPLLTMR